MAYSIQYGKSNKRKKRHEFSSWFALALLLLAICGRILSNGTLEQVQSVLFGDAKAVEVFYEEFVKH